MKQLCFLMVLIGVSISGVFAKEQALDKVVAVINDDVVTQTELNHAITIAKKQAEAQHVQIADAALKKQVLDQLINKKLQLQIAKQANLTIKDNDVNEAIARIAKSNNMTSAELFDRLKQEGMSPDEYKKEIHEQMTMRRLQQQEAVKALNVSDQEITAFMRSKVWETNALKEYQLEDVLIPIAEKPSAAELAVARERAEAVLAQMNQGKSFVEISNAMKGQVALQGGDLGWRRLPEIPTAFAAPISRLQKNQTAGPIQTGNGFHLVRLTDVHNLSGNAVPTRKQVQELLMQRKFEEAVLNWVSKLRGQSFIRTELTDA